ncbi:FK506-binding protein-like isoform X2 [Haliaeetus albicilla]|uniref:FK506-binding protein-like isoform X2 n=1 Tax=Haliaeetus albicilla TaxID=8969 RepID=UPI0037E8531A
MEGGDSANGAAEEPANGQRAPGGLPNGEGGSPVPASEELGGACAVGESSNGVALLLSSSEELPSSANEQLGGCQAAGDSANEKRGGLHGPASEEAGAQDPTNETAGHQGAANEKAEPHNLNNEVKGLRHPTNEDAVLRARTSQDPVPRITANKDAGPEAPTNEDASLQAPTSERAGRWDPADALRAPPDGASPRQASPSHEHVPLPVPPDGAGDPWDWSREEAWLRAPEEGEEEEEGWGQLEEEEEEDSEEGEGEGEGEEEDPWAGAGPPPGWWLSPDAAFAKRVLQRGRGLGRPGPGSRCRVRLETPPGAGAAAGWGAAAAGAGGSRWQTLRLGDGEGRWAAVLDACLETMAAGERARLRPAGAGAAVGVRLGGFSPAPPFWEEAPGGRWRAVLVRQERAAALLGAGAAGPAARAYAQALRAAVVAGGAPPLPPALARPKAELHAGLALCQLRLGLPAAAAANAGKALALRPGHLEARFRRALAAAAMSDLEAAAADLALVLREEPGHAGARRELRRVRGAARERDARLARRLGRLFA